MLYDRARVHEVEGRVAEREPLGSREDEADLVTETPLLEELLRVEESRGLDVETPDNVGAAPDLLTEGHFGAGLDVGCGWGRDLYAIAQEPRRAVEP